MIRFTTPTLQLTVDADLTGNKVFASLGQKGVKVTKEVDNFTVENNVTTVNMPLTQEDTGKFEATASVAVQVNWINATGDRGATDVQMVPSLQNLLDEVISYEEVGEDDGD